MEIEMNNSVPLWGILGALFAAMYFVWRMQLELTINKQRIDSLEKGFDKIFDKLNKMEDEIKELAKAK